jgi:hypothetical protein
MSAEQHDQNEDDHDYPYQAVAATPIIPAAISVIAATAAEQKYEDD